MLDKLKQRLEQLKYLDIDQIAEMFTYKVMRSECPDLCRLYKENKLCHDMKLDELNCYGCYCPNYKQEEIIDEETGLPKRGICVINSKFGFYKNKETYLILNCTNCIVPHRKKYIKKFIQKDLDFIN